MCRQVTTFETLIQSCEDYAPKDLEDPVKMLIDMKTKVTTPDRLSRPI